MTEENSVTMHYRTVVVKGSKINAGRISTKMKHITTDSNADAVL
jgi:hypothetical protein